MCQWMSNVDSLNYDLCRARYFHKKCFYCTIWWIYNDTRPTYLIQKESILLCFKALSYYYNSAFYNSCFLFYNLCLNIFFCLTSLITNNNCPHIYSSINIRSCTKDLTCHSCNPALIFINDHWPLSLKFILYTTLLLVTNTVCVWYCLGLCYNYYLLFE